MGTEEKNLEAEKLFDPGTLRDNPRATNYCETLMHLLKSIIGTGIFALPYAFKNAGTILGSIAMIVTALIVGHCSYIVVAAGHKFYFLSGRGVMKYAEVADYAFTNGPEFAKKYAKCLSVLVSITIFLMFFGTCSVYSIIVASNLRELILYFYDTDIHIRILLSILILPFILIVWIPNLKYLAPFSALANFCMLIIITIIFSFFFTNIPSDIEDRRKMDLMQLPGFVANAIFALDAIGIVMPLENDMKKPKQFLGLCGVLTVGTAISTIIYFAFGLCGYIRYGEDTEGAIMSNLPTDTIAGQIVKSLVALAIFISFAVQMYVCVDVIWHYMRDSFDEKYHLIVIYIIRTLLSITSVGLAIGIPIIAPFMGLLGALCFSILGIILPALIESTICWQFGFGILKWKLFKNIFLVILGLFVMIFGTLTSTIDLIDALKEV